MYILVQIWTDEEILTASRRCNKVKFVVKIRYNLSGIRADRAGYQ